MKDNILDLFDSIAIIGISVVLAMAFYYQLYFQRAYRVPYVCSKECH